jgi:hypothetical protein
VGQCGRTARGTNSARTPPPYQPHAVTNRDRARVAPGPGPPGAQGRDRVKMARAAGRVEHVLDVLVVGTDADCADPPSQPEETKRRIEEQCSHASVQKKDTGWDRVARQCKFHATNWKIAEGLKKHAKAKSKAAGHAMGETQWLN